MKLIIALLLAVATLTLGAPAQAAPTCQWLAHRGLYAGTENQPAGVTNAHENGWGIEGDAIPTAPDEDGDSAIMALHDSNLARLTGGDSTMAVGNVTLAELRSFDHPFGRFRRTTALINRAAELDSPIMINLHTAGDPWGAAAVDELYAAAQAHPHPQRVYFGGGGGSLDAMTRRHPDVATFHRPYSNDLTAEQIVNQIRVHGYDLVGLRAAYQTRATVDHVRAETDALIANNHAMKLDDVRQASRAGIRIIQTDGARMVRRGCDL